MKIEIDINIRKLTLVFVIIALLSAAIINARLDIDTNSVDYTGGSDFIISSDGNISIQATYDLNITSDVNVTGNVTADYGFFDKVGIGTNAPDSILHIKANIPGIVGSHHAGQLIIQNPGDSVFGNVAITAYESDGAGNPHQQLWYLGSSSVGNTEITYLNRRNSKLHLGTNGVSRLTILGNGNVGIGTTSPNEKLVVIGNVNVSGNLTVTGNITNDAIYAQLSDSTDQTFAVTGTGYNITFNTNDEINGITHSTTVEPQNITIVTTGVYSIMAQPQVHADPGASGYFHMWLRKDTGSGFADVANTNVELILSSNGEDVIPLIVVISLNAGDVIRVNASVAHTGIELDAQTPANEPAIPSIIFTMYRIGS